MNTQSVWSLLGHGLPAGGNVGQILYKTGIENYNVGWQDSGSGLWVNLDSVPDGEVYTRVLAQASDFINKATEHNTGLIWDDINQKLGLGKSPLSKLDVHGDINISEGFSFKINNVALSTVDIPEQTNLYFTEQRVKDTVLSEYSPALGYVSSEDSVAIAINKLGHDQHEFHYSGVLTVGFAIQDNGNGTATIPELDVCIFDNALGLGTPKKYTVTSKTFLFTDGVEEYVGVDYNNGAPILYKETVGTRLNHTTKLPIFTVWRQGNVIHSLGFDNLAINLPSKLQSSIYHTHKYSVTDDGGLIISEINSPNYRTITVTGGTVMTGAVGQTVNSLNSSVDELTLASVSNGVWSYTNQLVYDNTQYNPTSGLTTLGNNKYGVRWFYRSIGDAKQLFYVLGAEEYGKAIDASNAQPRNDLPLLLRNHCLLIGKSVIQLNANSGTTDSTLQRTYGVMYTPHHNDLTMLQGTGDDYYHLNATQYNVISPITSVDTDLHTVALTDTTLASAKAIKSYDDERWVLIKRRGFVDRTEATLSFNDTNYTFTLTSVGATWRYVYKGEVYTITGNKTVVLPGVPPTSGIYYIYIDSIDGTLLVSTSNWTLLDDKVPVATVVFSSTLTPKYILADERHTIAIDKMQHYYEHMTIGAQYASGGVVSGYSINTDLDTAKVFGITETLIMDEDIAHTLTSLTKPDAIALSYFVCYRNSPNTWAWRLSKLPYYYNDTEYIYYDNGGTMTQATGGGGNNARYVNSYLLYTNIEGTPRFMIIPGQNIFTTLAGAQAENPSTFDFSAFNIKEAVIAYQLTWTTVTSNSSGKCQLAVAPKRIIGANTNSLTYSNFNHDSLLGLQGGATGEYYHFTQAQYNALLALIPGV